MGAVLLLLLLTTTTDSTGNYYSQDSEGKGGGAFQCDFNAVTEGDADFAGYATKL